MKKTKALIFLALTSCIGLSACGRPMKIETTPELKANSTLVGQGTSSYEYRVELENSSSKYFGDGFEFFYKADGGTEYAHFDKENIFRNRILGPQQRAIFYETTYSLYSDGEIDVLASYEYVIDEKITFSNITIEENTVLENDYIVKYTAEGLKENKDYTFFLDIRYSYEMYTIEITEGRGSSRFLTNAPLNLDNLEVVGLHAMNYKYNDPDQVSFLEFLSDSLLTSTALVLLFVVGPMVAAAIIIPVSITKAARRRRARAAEQNNDKFE